MTRSNRRTGDEWSKHRITETSYRCEACNSVILHHFSGYYFCSKCGLEQQPKREHPTQDPSAPELWEIDDDDNDDEYEDMLRRKGNRK